MFFVPSVYSFCFGSTCCPIHNSEHLGGMCGVQQLKIQCGLKDAILLGGMDLFDATYVRWVEPQLFRFRLNCFVSASIVSFLPQLFRFCLNCFVSFCLFHVHSGACARTVQSCHPNLQTRLTASLVSTHWWISWFMLILGWMIYRVISWRWLASMASVCAR